MIKKIFYILVFILGVLNTSCQFESLTKKDSNSIYSNKNDGENFDGMGPIAGLYLLNLDDYECNLTPEVKISTYKDSIYIDKNGEIWQKGNPCFPTSNPLFTSHIDIKEYIPGLVGYGFGLYTHSPFIERAIAWCQDLDRSDSFDLIFIQSASGNLSFQMYENGMLVQESKMVNILFSKGIVTLNANLAEGSIKVVIDALLGINGPLHFGYPSQIELPFYSNNINIEEKYYCRIQNWN